MTTSSAFTHFIFNAQGRRSLISPKHWLSAMCVFIELALEGMASMNNLSALL